MEDDQAPLDPVPRPRRQICFCCGRRYGARQLARHRELYFNAEFAAAAAQGVELEGDEPGLGGDGMHMDDVDMEDGGDAVHDGEEGNVDPFADLALGLDHDLPAPPPGPMQANEIVRNPPVNINDWPEPGSDGELEDYEDYEGPDNDADRDPDYVERHVEPGQLGLNPLDEPGMADAQLRELMEADLGDLADEVWLELYGAFMTQKDERTLRFLATRLRTHFSRQTYNELRHGPCEPLRLPSEFIAWRRLKILSGVPLKAYDCCVNSCVCFLGKYEEMRVCPYCDEPRFTPAGRPRRTFHYTPLIPQLKALFRCSETVEKLRYRQRAEEEHEPDLYQDVFDGENYRTLRQTRVDPDHDYKFFDNPEDLALFFTTDGFTLFKRRRRGLSTAWPLLFINANLHPRYRNRLENVICVAVIPGPRQCKDINSYLIPSLEELLELQHGLDAFKAPPPGGDDRLVPFVLRAFLIMLFGDIPAVSKMLAIKGHNAKTPCRTCYMQGILCRRDNSSVYYLPLTPPGAARGIPPHLLLRRTHDLFLFHYDTLEAHDRYPARRARIAQEYGINSRPIFASLKSIDLASCAPYDIMHLLFENLVPNMILHWTGKFKGIDEGTGNYRLDEAAWNKIGELTAASAKTIPSAFVGTIPDIAQDRHLYKAEAFAFWAQYIAPIVLKDRLPRIYYRHFLLMREIIILCVQIDVTAAEVDELEQMVGQWVTDYERLYYQHQYDRLPACPLTIHALLHLPFYLRRTGPLCNSWTFVTERFCGRLLPAVKNRYQPYEHMDYYISRRAQMQAACHIFNLPMLPRSTVKWRFDGRERLSSRELMYPDFQHVILGSPVKRRPPVDVSLRNQMVTYFGTTYSREEWSEERQEVLRRIDFDTLVRYGRFRLTNDGDRIRTASSVERSPSARDNSFIRYDLLPDANARFRRRPDVPVRVTHYGQVLDVYYLEFIEDIEHNARRPFVLARVMECLTGGLDAALPENPYVIYDRMRSPSIIHIDTINAVIGRIQLERNTWAIIDVSRHGARTQFVDDDDDDE